MKGRVARHTTAKRLYRTLLLVYPAAFRDEYADELSLVFVDRYREARSMAQAVQVWGESIWGILQEAPREHFHLVVQDLRQAFRILRKDPGASAAAIVILALGIGSATLVFSLANGLMLRPLPYLQIDRIVAVDEYSPTDPSEKGTVNFLNYLDFRARTRLMTDLGVYDYGDITITRPGSAAVVPGALVSDGVFSVAGVEPLIGRTLSREDCVPGGPKVAIVSEGFWRERYGGDPSVIGKELDTTSTRYRIIGIMPAAFHFPERAELWFPLQTDPAKANRTDYHLRVIGRLKPGVSVDAAEAELESMLQQIHRENPAANNGWHVRATRLRNSLTGEYRKAVITLLVAAGFLLLIACANVGNLLLVRASARRRELAIRRAIGANRRQLVRQLAVESLVLGVLAGVVSIFLAYLGTPALLSLIPVHLPSWMNFSVDYRVLLFGLVVALLTALGSGVAPMLGATGRDLTLALKEGGHGGTAGRRQKTVRQGFVIAEIALSVALLIGAGLMIRSFRALRLQNLGYAPENVLSLHINYSDDSYPDGPNARALVDRITYELSTLPGVLSVAAMTEPPLETSWTRLFTIEGHPVALKDTPFVPHMIVTPGYFHTLRLTLLQGRDFTEADYDTNVLIVSKSFARQHWPQESAIGKRVRFGPPKNREPWHTVVGVVADSKQRDLKQLDGAVVYLPYSAEVTPRAFVVRTAFQPLKLAKAIRTRIAAVDSSIAVSRVLTLEEILTRVSWRERFLAVLVTCFTAIALVLAAAGFYATLSYVVALQRHEIGIRMALGASYADIGRLVISQGLRIAGVGLAYGVAAAFGLTRFLRSQLFDVSPTDPTAWTAAVAVFVAVAVLATLEPARSATRVDPVVALRQE